MGECDRKPRLVVGGKFVYTVTRCEAPMLLHRIVVEYNKVTVNKFSEVLLYKNKYKTPISHVNQLIGVLFILN